MGLTKNIFEKVDTVCSVCGTPLTTPNARHIGDKYYCIDDYEQELEKPINTKKSENNKRFKKNFKGFGGEL